jgi:hypothetical protein
MARFSGAADATDAIGPIVTVTAAKASPIMDLRILFPSSRPLFPGSTTRRGDASTMFRRRIAG